MPNHREHLIGSSYHKCILFILMLWKRLCVIISRCSEAELISISSRSIPRSCLKWREGLDTAAFIDPTKALYLLFSPRSWKGTFEMRQRKWLKTNQIELLMLLTLKIDLLKPCCCTISNNFQTRSLINVCSNSKSHSRPFPLSFCFASHKPAAACFHPFPWLQVGSRTQRN